MTHSNYWLPRWLYWIFHHHNQKNVPKPLPQHILNLHTAVDVLDVQWYPSDLESIYTAWLIGVNDFCDLPLTDSETNALVSLQQMVNGLETMQVVPRLPAIIPQLMHSLRDDTVGIAQLAQQIKRDPVLVGEVICLANSPYYRRQHKISSIEQAVLLLGQNGLRQLVSRIAFYPILNLRAGTITRLTSEHLWTQSEQCALICRCLADHKKVDTFAAYLAGLVANIGVLSGLHCLDQCFNVRASGVPRTPIFYTRFAQIAKQFSHRIVTEWTFPEPIILALREQTDVDATVPQSILGRIVSAGDHCSKYCLLKTPMRLLPMRLLVSTQQPFINHPCYSPFL